MERVFGNNALAELCGPLGGQKSKSEERRAKSEEEEAEILQAPAAFHL